MHLIISISNNVLYIFWSASVIGLYTSYITPIFLRITSGRDKFVPGPFHLGHWSLVTGTISVAWVTFIVVVLLFPPGSSVTPESMSKRPLFYCPPRVPTYWHACAVDYAVVIVLAVFIFASISWIVSARKWFTGPISNVNKPDVSNTTSVEEKKVLETWCREYWQEITAWVL